MNPFSVVTLLELVLVGTLVDKNEIPRKRLDMEGTLRLLRT